MIRIFLFLLTLCSAGFAGAQCKSGNCQDGKGVYDFGWCSYEGEFKNGKPDGTGSMKYSDYTYTGHFTDGVEDGQGVLVYVDGHKENVRYSKGGRVEGPVHVDSSDYKPIDPQDPGCISGNCRTGFGTYVFPSGNKYTGNFKDRKREGQGTAYLADGDQFTGTWHDNEKVQGTYTFSTGPYYTGTYDANGKELNGKIVAGSLVVPFVNGVAKVPPEPKITYTYSNSKAPGAPTETAFKPMCMQCFGSGKIHHTIFSNDRYDAHGNSVFGEYTTCFACGGKGYK
jgi:hypothetical protein